MCAGVRILFTLQKNRAYNILIHILENENLIHDYCIHTVYQCPKKKLVSRKKGSLHASLALRSKELLQIRVSCYADIEIFGISTRLQTWSWNAKINPLKERLDRAVWQLLPGAPWQCLYVLYRGGCITARWHVLDYHQFPTTEFRCMCERERKNPESMPDTAIDCK